MDEATANELAKKIEQILESDSTDLLELAKLAGLSPLQDFKAFDLSGADLRRADLSRTDLRRATFEQAKVENCQFGNGNGLAESTKADLKERGAIFDDAPGDRSSVDTRSPVHR